MPTAAGDMAVHKIKHYTTWCEDHSLTRSNGVIVDSDGSATRNGNRSQEASMPVPSLLPCGTSKAPGKTSTGQIEYSSQPLPKALPFIINALLHIHI